jgi:hypothetical protein
MSQQPVCQVCGSLDLKEVLNLGLQPLCNEFKLLSQLNSPETYYPLSLVYCADCETVQLSYIIPTKQVFGEQYTYLTGSTRAVVDYFNDLAAQLIQRFSLVKGDVVVDIGSNDGTFLNAFKCFGVDVLGVEGSPKPVAFAEANGIKTIPSFFGKGISESVKEEVSNLNRVKLVTAMNVIAHTDNINEFLDEVKLMMSPETVFVTQSHYLISLLGNLEFDTIYHEHLRYYSLKSLINLFTMHGFTVFDAEVVDVYGGSIVVYASLNDGEPVTDRFLSLLKDENEADILERFRETKNAILRNKAELLNRLYRYKEQGKHIIGVGAPMKSSTFLNFYGITPDLIDYLTEVNPLKIGTLSPGVHIPVVDEAIVFCEQPDYALILSWNIANQIMKSYRQKGYKGEFIVPIPKLRIDKDGEKDLEKTTIKKKQGDER